MPWIKVDDHFDEHPKFAEAGPLGMAMWLAGMAYSNRNLTDGYIPWGTARSLLTWKFLEPANEHGQRRVMTVGVTSGHAGDDVDCEYVIGLLINAGLWEQDDNGYRIHDYRLYQPSRREVLKERGRLSNIRSEVGKKGAANRKPNGIQSGKQTGKQTDIQTGQQTSQQTYSPVPVPVPLVSSGYTGSTSLVDASAPVKADSTRKDH